MIVIEAELALLGGRAAFQVVSPVPPFRVDLQTRWARLAWPDGVCDVPAMGVYWGGRYAAVSCGGIAIIDALGEAHAHLQFDVPDGAPMSVEDGWLRVGAMHGALSLPLVAMEQLAASPGAVELHLNVVYPLRRPDVREPAIVAWLYDNGDAVVNVAGKQIWLDSRPYGLARAMKFELCDELWPGEYVTIAVPGQPERALRDLETERVITGHVVRGLPPHPLRHWLQPATLRVDRVAPLLERIADHPDDDETRGVLVDVLQDQGAPYARGLAEARAAGRAHEWALAKYLTPLECVLHGFEWRAGLPYAARMQPEVHADDDLLALIGSDVRLGMLVRIKRDNASIENYARVLAMPAAICLREVDSCSPVLLETLIEARRDRLARLHGIQLGKHRTHELLAHPTFDRVVELTCNVSRSNLDRALDQLETDPHGWLSRAPRKIAFASEQGGAEPVLPVEQVVTRWRRLRVLEINVGGVTLQRTALSASAPASVHFATTANSDTRDLVRRLLPELSDDA